MNILLTKNTTPVIGWVAEILGLLMNGIFYVINAIGFPNVAFAIILFTIIMYLLMTPLQIRQQKFSKMTAVMQPELQKIQKKYGNKKDEASMQKMNQETQAVYDKYGVSPMGSCVQLLIQFPVLISLYQVIYRIPGYITVIGDKLGTLASEAGFAEFFTDFIENLGAKLTIANDSKEAIVDVIYKLNPSQWSQLAEASQGQSFYNEVVSTQEQMSVWTNFCGLNIADSPSTIISSAFANKQWLLIVAAIAIPALAWLTQWLNYKLMPQASSNTNSNDTAGNTMKQMNTFMPIMSAVFCYTLPVGIGVYWIAGAVIRSVQQLIINKQMDKIDINDLIQENLEKANKKREKQGLPPQKITNQARVNVRNLEVDKEEKAKRASDAAEKAKASTEYYKSSSYKPGSIASKANMVKQYDERNMKKK